MVNFNTMIKRFYPDAKPEEDFTTETAEDGSVKLKTWNTKKLGTEPDVAKLHEKYMKIAKEIKVYSPKFDDADPAPWLNPKKPEEPENIRHSSISNTYIQNTHLPIVNFDPETGLVTSYKGDAGNE